MWSNKNKSLTFCTECRTDLPARAEACPECGYPATVPGREESSIGVRSGLLEYKLIQLLGATIFGIGMIAAAVDSPIAATVAIIVGCATYMSGLLGSWWNSGD